MNKLNILARGKDKTGHWIIGSYFPSIISLASPFDGTENSYKHYIICNGCGDWRLPCSMDIHEVCEESIGYYINDVDMNNQRIFSGDIIDIHQTVNGYSKFVVTWDGFSFGAKYYDESKNTIGRNYEYDVKELFDYGIYFADKEVEVVGNIIDGVINKN